MLEAINEHFPEVGESLHKALAFAHKWYLYGNALWTRCPAMLRYVVMAAFFMAIFGTITSLIKAVSNNYKEWKPMPNSKLTFSYFCGSGDYQRKLIHENAKKLVADRTWPWVSIAGLAYRLGKVSHDSKIIMFLLSVVYLSLAIIGCIELVFRAVIGYVAYCALNIVAMVTFFAIRLVTYLLIPMFRVVDAAMRVEQHCPYCYDTFKLPHFRCPHCNEVHEQLIPAKSGLLFARCSCGHFLPCAVLTKRDRLASICPKCNRDLAASNTKSFSIQVIGGDSAGKTAFISAFQHMYRDNINQEKCAIRGEPKAAFENIESMFVQGCPIPSSASEVIPYTLVHQLGASAENSLVFYDIPDEVLLSEEYERNPLNFGFSDGIVVIVDPLCVQSVRDECGRLDAATIDGFSQDSVESIVIHFIAKFSEISGRAARRLSNIPVAVLVAKSDIGVVQSRIGPAAIAAAYWANPARYQNDIEMATDKICRNYLSDIGLANILNNLDAVFSMVRCFPISSIGHAAKRGYPFEPYGVVEPIAWIGQCGHAPMAAQLREAQKCVTADGFQEDMADRNLTKQYAKAERLVQESKFYEAIDVFMGLGDYRDAAERLGQVRKTCYSAALKKRYDQDFDGAIKDFTTLGSYKDSVQQIVSTQYAKVDYLISLQRYQDALGILGAMQKSNTVAEKVREVKYDYALFLVQSEEYISANDIFEQLDDYKDCRKKATEIFLNLTRQRIATGAKRKIKFGKYEWRVLTINNGSAMIITENIVMMLPYGEVGIDGTCWSDSGVRKYLNTTFFNEFDAAEKAVIQEVLIKTPKNPEYGTPGGADTKDRVFLLSIEEALKFFHDDADRRPYESSPGIVADWAWLRSPGGENAFAAIIEKGGKVSAGGSRVTNVRGGARPAMFIKL